ncbi:hypothetical protein SADUNF_Sadunf02G0029000 [Salix dunnii]|uniref:Uncharacterized protein n=1 Tax=Salix dunnii TaxID=1413687 RepID=A0A835N609_9ROSI|nr:hypothetical protein SADUNF_Sadunf02G0029000 [Salix dunnii]
MSYWWNVRKDKEVASQEFSEDLWKTEWEGVGKWVCEKMEESDFYKRLNSVREEESCREKAAEEGENSVTMGEQKPKAVTFPMRHGKMKYKIYGLIFLILSGLKLLIESLSQRSVIGQRNPSQYLGNANCKAGNLDRAREALESLRSYGF